MLITKAFPANARARAANSVTRPAGWSPGAAGRTPVAASTPSTASANCVSRTRSSELWTWSCAVKYSLYSAFAVVSAPRAQPRTDVSMAVTTSVRFVARRPRNARRSARSNVTNVDMAVPPRVAARSVRIGDHFTVGARSGRHGPPELSARRRGKPASAWEPATPGFPGALGVLALGLGDRERRVAARPAGEAGGKLLTLVDRGA